MLLPKYHPHDFYGFAVTGVIGSAFTSEIQPALPNLCHSCFVPEIARICQKLSFHYKPRRNSLALHHFIAASDTDRVTIIVTQVMFKWRKSPE